MRLHTLPVCEVVLPTDGKALRPVDIATSIWPQIRSRVAAHLDADGVPVPDRLPLTGLPRLPAPNCLRGQTLTAPEAPTATIVIDADDRPASLIHCLASLSRLDYPAEFDVVVIDSTPGGTTTAEALGKTSAWPFELRYLRTARHGSALAHNTALPFVTGRLVAFIDNDVEVDPRWLAALAEGFTDPSATCVTGLILPAELETHAQLWMEQAGGFTRGFTRLDYRKGRPPPDGLFPFTAGRFGSGMNMAFRTEWLLGTGGFDPATGAGTPARGGDDLIAFLRVIMDGKLLVYQPAAIVRHRHRREYAGLRKQSYGYGVGLGAYLTASLCEDPALLAPMLRRAAPAMRYLLGRGSAKNAGKQPGFPLELVWRERLGLCAGPFAYATSRWQHRKTERPTWKVAG
ncbi:glycosyltransferase family 2 protein [Rhodococcus spelaei]|uniref:glycosyltransferase family 2 protein n=1 Tax=Rhodococcus spelaei TaxID=2546320 RepID=UPI0015EFA62F|nr:glycosyltransferase [Rhodococcus spelaei]